MKKLCTLLLLISTYCFSQNIGDIIITEINQNPSAIPDNFGEWFEVYNSTNLPINLNSWTIKDAPGALQQSHIISGAVIVPANGYITLGRSGNTNPLDSTYNGGINHAYVYDFSFQLSNGDDEIILEAGGIVIDEVYFDGGSTFPDPNGASMSLNPNSLNSTSNDFGSNWCTSTSFLITGDLGTPNNSNDACGPTCSLNLGNPITSCVTNTNGVDLYDASISFSGGANATYSLSATSGIIAGDNPTNAASGNILINLITEATNVTLTVTGGFCNLSKSITGAICLPTTCANAGDIIITEIMQNPDFVNDTIGEWFEIFNTTNAAINLQGWDIKDLGNDSHTILNPLIVAANSFAVLAMSSNTSINGGVNVDYAYGTSFSLTNADDEIILSCANNIIDEVYYDGGINFPDPIGISMNLDPTNFTAVANNVGANWCLSSTSFAAGDLGTPGTSNDPCASCNVNVGDIIVTEIMQNPSSVSDSNGEWFEVYNTTNVAINMLGWTISDLGSNNHSITNSLIVPANGYAVLGKTTDLILNGGVNIDYAYSSGMSLQNGADQIIITCIGGTIIDEVYYDGGINFPDPTGISMILEINALNGTANDVGSNWCISSSTYGTGTDLGTPGSLNDICNFCTAMAGDIIITEIMQNPDSISDVLGEWFEIYNFTNSAINMSGWTISDLGSNLHVITTLNVPAGGFAVLARTDDLTINGGLAVDYVYGTTGFSLGNTADQIIITCDGNIIDEVNYDGGPTFPDPNGASMSLDPNLFGDVNNDSGSNWCVSTSVYGDVNIGNLGTPGTVNDACINCDFSLTVNSNPIPDNIYKAISFVSSAGVVPSLGNVEMFASDTIILEIGFDCNINADLYLHIDDCE